MQITILAHTAYTPGDITSLSLDCGRKIEHLGVKKRESKQKKQHVQIKLAYRANHRLTMPVRGERGKHIRNDWKVIFIIHQETAIISVKITSMTVGSKTSKTEAEMFGKVYGAVLYSWRNYQRDEWIKQAGADIRTHLYSYFVLGSLFFFLLPFLLQFLNMFLPLFTTFMSVQLWVTTPTSFNQNNEKRG